ncbi:MAG TPA: bifunctional adenosylcobinamide kinase/adenosylcobinamide-phosphate guanylyltransferase [Terriglobia bacterium]|nr:bifunctional adenosylcobinamide kinase/adenosylcobinamide-phosphate guanylyltransferase [Terriglobia bacterium]
MPPTSTRTVTLVLGGARSGKSRYAQRLASTYRKVVFVATAQPGDSEMRRKIAAHRRQRPASWKTVEAPNNLDRIIREESPGADVLVIDCLTLYLAHLMGDDGGRRAVRLRIRQVCKAIQTSRASIILVSNEVGSGIVPAFRSGRDYRDLLGELNQKIAGLADRVVLMVAGLPINCKGGAGESRPRA